MSTSKKPRDPSDPNDIRNWNGHAGPTFLAADPFDVNKKTVLYSSFTLQPVPAHLLPPGVCADPNDFVVPVPADELEEELKRLPPRAPIPPRILVNPIFSGVVLNVRNQNPDQRKPPTRAQLLQEFTRQNALTFFHRRHMQLLEELARHLGNGGSAFEHFTSHPDLEALVKEIVEHMGSEDPQITSVHIQDEVALRVREGLSQDTTDHNIHQLQHLLSRIIQQINRDQVGNSTVPEELQDDTLYQQIQDVLEGQGIMSSHNAMRDDLVRRIRELRDQRSRELREGSTSKPVAVATVPTLSKRVLKPTPAATSRATSTTTPGATISRRTMPIFTPEETPESIAIQTPQDNAIFPQPRSDILDYNMQPTSAAGLPFGFAFDPAWSEKLRVSSNSVLNSTTLPYYVNDGPRAPHEGETQYRRRIKRAVENMGIEHRLVPVLTDKDLRQYKGDKKAIAKARRALKNQVARDSTTHLYKLRNEGNKNRYDEEYAMMWEAEKRARQARNAMRRRNAQERLRAEILKFPESLGQRLPTPPPPDDSGDELYDFTISNGPREVDLRQDFQGRLKRDRDDRSPRTGTRSPQVPAGEQSKVPIKCVGCEQFRAYCSLPETGAPCLRCKQWGQACLQQDQERCWTVFNSQTVAVPTGTSKETQSANGGSYNTDSQYRQGGRPPTIETEFGRMPNRSRDNRSRSPTRDGGDLETAGFGFDHWIPCNACLVNGRACDKDGPPCRSCVLHGVEESCSSAGAENQTFQAQPSMMEYDPAQLGRIPDIGASPDAWERVNALLEAGATLTSGDDINPYQSVTQATPGSPVDWAEVGKQLGFSRNPMLANASAEMAAQSVNWVSKEDQVWSGGAQYNAFGQELDMHGNIVPGGRLFNGIVDLDPDRPVNSLENGYSSGNPFNVNTETDEVEVNNFFNLYEDSGTDLFTYIQEKDQVDTAMGGTTDEPLNPSLPTDALSLGQDPSRLPDYDIPEDPVLPDIDALAALQSVPAQNSAPCDEPVEYFTNWTGALCCNVPTKSCDHTSHSDHHICISCHAEQNLHLGQAQENVIEGTKRWMCAPCASNANALARAGLPVNAETNPDEMVMVAMCMCTLQLRKTWLCHRHRDQAITRVKVRTARMQELVIRMSDGGVPKCAFCMEREQDPMTGAWACVCCYRIPAAKQ
ncbi:hypothetical protein BKA65DRAFT_479723 [Rhexocercosporidium sp. MPI-PUGE-AT-0058]|nr:hypothetical protein BKA65DRAFT_479723 [Rhexocercosporidium sp. MPI-PUGE-AT-0058]